MIVETKNGIVEMPIRPKNFNVPFRGFVVQPLEGPLETIPEESTFAVNSIDLNETRLEESSFCFLV